MNIKMSKFLKKWASKRGFSLLEVIVSAGAFVVFAMLIQNVLLLAHSFQVSQKNLLESFQINSMIKQKVCMANSAFKNRNIDPLASYIKVPEQRTVDVPTDTGTEGNPNPVYFTEYKKLSSVLNQPALNQPVGVLRMDLGENPSDNIFKDVLKDSHTLVVLNSNSETLSEKVDDKKSAKFLSGYVFASRCVRVDPSSIKEVEGGQQQTFDSQNLNNSAKEILELNYRPYYFPKSDRHTGEDSVVLCCLDGSDRDLCQSAIQDYVPRIYIIHFMRSEMEISGSGSPPPPLPKFAGKINAIQEFPEWQDLDTLWGAGFMLSMDQKRHFNQSAFHLDIMLLKNTCATSLGHIKNCALLSPGKNPATQKLTNIEGQNLTMAKFITANVSSCSGYSSGIDTSSAIIF